MDTSTLKTFAPAVRKQLMEAVTRKLDFALSAQTPDYLTTFAPQVAALRNLAQADRPGLIERVAYTWFNRLAALRFMDARGWHPFRARVLTPASAAETQPELLKLTRTEALPEELKSHTNPTRLNDLLDGRIPSPDAQGEVYRLLVLAACRFYHALLPNLFEKLDDETELLLPDDLLTEHSVVHGFRTEISDEDCGDGQRANVEILGWLYQFYISERKDQVMARKSAVPTEDIPAVTQLFTPHWIVRYLVENSLGRLWLLNRPGSRLREHMPYYIEDSGQGAVASGQKEGYANTNLQGSDRVAKGDGSGGNRPSTQPVVSKGGTLRVDQSTAPGGGISALEHRGGTGAAVHGGVLELPLDRPGIAGRSGDATAAGHPVRISDDTASLSRPHPAGGNLQNAGESALQAGHWPLTTDHSAAGQGTPETYLKIERPEDIRLLDPAAGSGHMLTYAFDLLTLIYEEEGYAPTEIPALILRHNLHGLEICPRAAQLAELALVFKAREKSRRFFQPEHLVRPHIIELRDVHFDEGELAAYFNAIEPAASSNPHSAIRNPQFVKLLHQFEEAKNFGSLIQPCLDERAIADARRAIEAKDLGGQLFLRETHLKVLRVLEQAEALTQRYHVVVANPPYMGSRQMNGRLRVFAEENFPKSKSDLLAMFVERNLELVKGHGFIAMITMHSWMFLSAYDDLRSDLLNSSSLVTLAHLGPRAFDSISGEVVQTAAFCLKKISSQAQAICFRLVEGSNEAEKERALLRHENRFLITNADIRKLPRCVFAYWLDEKLRHVFQLRKFGDISDGEGKNVTADNARFLRLVWEVESNKLGRGKKWLLYAKGGANRKWAGNLEHVVDWSDSSRLFYRKNNASRIIEERFWYRPGITWSVIGGSGTGFRHLPADTTFDTKGLALFTKDNTKVFEALGLMNSVVTGVILPTLNPTMCINTVDVKSIPVPNALPECSECVNELVSIARADWDNFETSWDFRDQPLLRPGLKGATLEASWRNWEARSTAAIRRMQELETENNRLFIAAYGLDGELEPAVPEEQITLARAEARRDMAAFLSYAVGCMMGRYSPDHPGLILANAGDTLREFLEKVEKPQAELTFAPDEDGIIPVLDGEWFEDDIVSRTRDFLRATFGEATLRENLRFLEDSLGKDLRKYFLTDFYKDHLQTYKKRPIYWLVQSPRRGFSVLLYLHRYTRDTMNLVLNRYLRDYQVKLRNRLAHVTELQVPAATAKAKTEARKEAEKLTKILTECEEWERQTLLPLAQARIELDLDDGVKTNYLKLGEALAPIAGLAAKEED